ncbi:hypothetical protein VTH06DRAFT_8008 [Thermothelomyces fergusii]
MADNLPSGTEFRAGRADSTSSTSSTGSRTPTQTQTQTPTQTPAQAQAQAQSHARAQTAQADSGSWSRQHGFRRPSHPLFEGLTAQKRKDDPESVARRQSLSEQRAKPGFLGQMWNTRWVRGEK